MELKKIKWYIVWFAIWTTLWLTAFTNWWSFTWITSMTQTWFNAIQTKLDWTYTSGKMCTSDWSGQIQCITDIPVAWWWIPTNSQTFTANWTFTVPAGVTRLMVYWGGWGGWWGGGTPGGTSNYWYGWGGWAPTVLLIPSILTVTSWQVISVNIGAWWVWWSPRTSLLYSGWAGWNWGVTTFGTLVFQGGFWWAWWASLWWRWLWWRTTYDSNYVTIAWNWWNPISLPLTVWVWWIGGTSTINSGSNWSPGGAVKSATAGGWAWWAWASGVVVVYR